MTQCRAAPITSPLSGPNWQISALPTVRQKNEGTTVNRKHALAALFVFPIFIATFQSTNEPTLVHKEPTKNPHCATLSSKREGKKKFTIPFWRNLRGKLETFLTSKLHQRCIQPSLEVHFQPSLKVCPFDCQTFEAPIAHEEHFAK